ncbi:MAG: ferrous iron transport protein A [Endozoicomonadaceae bacterium]|nr:ferrous iron transport protein A [Endozoicomonadaceae bacterium]
MTLTLGDLTVGDSGTITGFTSDQRAYRRKLLSMGMTPGTSFRVCRVAPLGDPIELELRGFQLSLRKDEARIVKVTG